MDGIFNSRFLWRSFSLLIPILVFFISGKVLTSIDSNRTNTTTFEITFPLDATFAKQQNIVPNPKVDKVVITGFFSDWAADNPNYYLTKYDSSSWRISIPLPAGDVQYKFIVYEQGNQNGIWINDPLEKDLASDSYGGGNSVINIPDFSFYQLVLDIISLGTFVFFATYYLLLWLLKALIHRRIPFSQKVIISTLIIVLISNAFLVLYQVFESRRLVKQGVIDSVHWVHLYLQSQGIEMQNLETDRQALNEALNAIFWPAKTRVETNQNSIVQVTLSDIAIYDPNRNLILVQSRQQNSDLQKQRMQHSGFNSVEDYFAQGVFKNIFNGASLLPSKSQVTTSHPSAAITAIETEETKWARQLLGFSNVLVPIVDNGINYGYYAVAIQVKLFGKHIERIIQINIGLLFIVLVLGYFLLRSAGKITTQNLTQLTQWAQRINRGDLNTQVNIQTNDEIQLLADNFAEMQRSLKQSFSKIQEQNSLLNKAAYEDLSTGLPNRNKLAIDLQSSLRKSLIIIQLEEYQQLHNFLGESICTMLMTEVIDRVSEHLQPFENHCLYRLSPNQLCLAIATGQQQTLLSLCSQLLNDIAQHPFTVEQIHINLTAKIGACAANFNTEDSGSCIANAQLALQSALRTNRDVAFYEHTLNKGKAIEKNLLLIDKIRHAIHTENIIPFLQPIVHTSSRQIFANECLMRLKDKEGNIVTPWEFLSAAKQAGLYQTISQMMIATCIEKLQYIDGNITLNLAAYDIENSQARQSITDLLKQNRQHANRVTLEITESEPFENYSLVKDFIAEIKSIGCKIALDDFGAGYSNFNHILSLNIDYIKIDGSLIKNLDSDVNAMKITKAIVECARSLQIETVAEYVHSEEIYHIVQSLGIDYCQGFYFGEPAPFK